MEEKKKENKFLNWIKKHSTEIVAGIFAGGAIVIEGALLCKASQKNSELEKKNQELEKENQTLRGEVRECERENKRLSRENGNLNYQLGKKSAKG